MCSNLATSTRGQKSTRHATASHRRTVTVTATDYEFQRAVLCCLAAGWSQSPSTLMQSRHGQHRPCASVHVQVADAEPSMHQTSLHETAQRPPSPWPVPITLRASVPASTVQCRWREASRCWQQACMVPKHGRQSVRYVQRAQTSPVQLCAGCAGQLSNNPVGCGQNSVAVTNK
jgi:hypothetical protein